MVVEQQMTSHATRMVMHSRVCQAKGQIQHVKLILIRLWQLLVVFLILR